MPVMLRIKKKYRKIAEDILHLKDKMFDRKKREKKNKDTDKDDNTSVKDVSENG